MTVERATALPVAFVVALGLAACGGGGTTTGSTTHATTTTRPATTTAPGQRGGKSSVTTGPVHGVLRADNHAPRVKRLWAYSVRVTDAAGRPLAGRVEIEFMFGGQVVGRDTPPTHPVKNGRWQDKLTFPPAAVGQPLTFRAVVHTRLGSITLDWPITVRR
jgi:hypothetical protein